MKDAKFTLIQALPAAAANNNTTSIDLNIEAPSAKWRQANIEVAVPALSDHTNVSVTNTLTLQDSSDNSTFANTQPLIQIAVVGVASTGSLASTVKVPLPPACRRYVRFNQAVPANGGTGSNANVAYDVVT
jgi:hypothetical protein